MLSPHVWVPLAAVALGSGLAACGGGSGTKAAAATGSTTPSAQAFINCLKSHGYTPPAALIQRLNSPPTTDANGGGGGFFIFGGGGGGGDAAGGAGGGGSSTPSTPRTTLDPAQVQARQQAFTACQSQAPAGFRFGGGRGGQAFTALRAYISCLNDHGYTKITVPTTVPGGQPPAGGFGGGPGVGGGAGLRQQLQALQSDPSAAAAVAACKPLVPTFRTTTTTVAS
jgi:hypothetical protein